MLQPTRRSFVLALAALALAACDGPQPTTITGNTPILPQRRLIARIRQTVTGENSAIPPGSDVIVLDATSSSTATVGQLVVVELAMSSGTGYSWRCIDAANATSVLTPKFDATKGNGVEHAVDGSRPGGTVSCVFSFTALAAGTATLTFDLVRPWEKDAPPTDRRILTLEVSAR